MAFTCISQQHIDTYYFITFVSSSETWMFWMLPSAVIRNKCQCNLFFSCQLFFLLFSKADRILAKTFNDTLQEQILVPSSAVFIETSLTKLHFSSLIARTFLASLCSQKTIPYNILFYCCTVHFDNVKIIFTNKWTFY